METGTEMTVAQLDICAETFRWQVGRRRVPMGGWCMHARVHGFGNGWVRRWLLERVCWWSPG